ncbi:MAG: ribonuclease P protein component [Odoribacteraceae bacterium]|jgi:ribonuclease P protein component|nr:ribonuclease P protein component [Odoribacteraceae bacterium]
MEPEATPRHTFSKQERLYLKQRINALLAGGESFVSYPLRVIFRLSERLDGEPPARVAVSVSKKRFKRAVDRNRVKRLTREAFRLNKHHLHDLLPADQGADILLIYLAETIADFTKLEKTMKHAFKKMRGIMVAKGDNIPAPDPR